MGKRSPPRNEPAERSAIPLVVAIIGLAASVASFAITDEDLSSTICGCGLRRAGCRGSEWI